MSEPYSLEGHVRDTLDRIDDRLGELPMERIARALEKIAERMPGNGSSLNLLRSAKALSIKLEVINRDRSYMPTWQIAAQQIEQELAAMRRDIDHEDDHWREILASKP